MAKIDTISALHQIIENAMISRDRMVSIFFGKEGVSVTVYPYSMEDTDGESTK